MFKKILPAAAALLALSLFSACSDDDSSSPALGTMSCSVEKTSNNSVRMTVSAEGISTSVSTIRIDGDSAYTTVSNTFSSLMSAEDVEYECYEAKLDAEKEGGQVTCSGNNVTTESVDYSEESVDSVYDTGLKFCDEVLQMDANGDFEIEDDDEE